MRAVIVFASLLLASPALAQEQDANFDQATYVSGLGNLTGLSWGSFGGENVLFISQRNGVIRVVRNGTLQATPFATVSPCNSTTNGECGLQSIVADPQMSSNGRLYVFVTESGDGNTGLGGNPPNTTTPDGVQRIHVYTAAMSGSDLVGTAKTALGPVLPTRGANHNGGGLSIGADGYLYWGVGNLNNGVNRGGNGNARGTTELWGSMGSKIGRMDRFNGQAPASNPHYTGSPTDNQSYIYARGLRNPFGLHHHPSTGNLWLTQVGDGWEQIFLVSSGANLGWPTENNTNTTNGIEIPEYAYSSGGGRALTKGTFYSGTAFLPEYRNDLFYCEHVQSQIWRCRMNAGGTGLLGATGTQGTTTPQNPTLFVTNAGNPTDIKTGPDGALYYARFGGIVTRLYSVSSVPAPVITTEPTSQTATEGQTATFTVVASGTGLSYQWQWNNGGTWTNVGANSASYTTPATTMAMNGRQYRVVVSNGGGSDTSAVATLTVNAAAPAITQHPQNQSVTEGQTATFSVVATSSVAVSYQWQVSTDGGVNWTNVGTNSAGYTTPATTLAMSGNRYRVRVTNTSAGGANALSNSATLTVTTASSPPVITANPANQTVTAPATATFTVGATGSGLSYQWQRQNPGSATWSNVGTNSASYTTPATSVAADNGAGYRVIVSGTGGPPVTSVTAILTVNGPPAATPTFNPAGGTYSGPVTVRISSATPGAAIRYTTDGSTPTGTSPVYGAPIVMSATGTARAIATATGYSTSAVGSAAFTINGGTPYGLPYLEDLAGVTIPATPTGGLPTTLSGTGLFSNLGTLAPGTGLLPFTVNSPLWSDGAAKQRWIGLPAGAKVGFNATGEWSFPDGTVFVKHFSLGARRLETRVFRIGNPLTNSYGVTYRWRADNSDADLLTNTDASQDETVPGPGGNQTWSFPGRNQCNACHTQAAGVVLGPKTRQLNGNFAYPNGNADNQIRTWNYLQRFAAPVNEAAIPGYARLVPIDDAGSPLETRVRSYLDSNCGGCHRGPTQQIGRSVWDARWDTPLANQGIVNAAIAADPLTLTNPLIVRPSVVPQSMLHHRASFRGLNQMPPLGSNVVDAVAVQAIADWINSMAGPTVTGLVLHNADTDVAIGPVTDGAVFDLATLPANLTLVAGANTAAESVVFTWAGAGSPHTESTAPFAIAGDTAGDLIAWPDFPQTAGASITVTITPYALDGGAGAAGAPLVVTFSVSDSTPPPPTPTPPPAPTPTPPPAPAPTPPPGGGGGPGGGGNTPQGDARRGVDEQCWGAVGSGLPFGSALLGALAALAAALAGRRRAKP